MEVHSWAKVTHGPGNAGLGWLRTYPSDSDSDLQPLQKVEDIGLTVKMLKYKWDERSDVQSLGRTSIFKQI